MENTAYHFYFLCNILYNWNNRCFSYHYHRYTVYSMDDLYDSLKLSSQKNNTTL